MVFSIESEFVENIKECESKQDCETKAFKILVRKLKNISKITNNNIRRCIVCKRTNTKHMLKSTVLDILVF